MTDKYYGVRNKYDISKTKVYSIKDITDYDAQIGGKGVKSKKFPSESEAQKFVDQFKKYQKTFLTDGKVDKDKVDKFNQEIEKIIANLGSDEAIAFTDGSYKDNSSKTKAGYAAILFSSDGEKDFSGIIDKDVVEHRRNTIAEIKAVETAIKWADDNQKKHLTIYYDFAELGDWALGFDDRTIPMTKKFKEFCDSATVNIDWFNVPGHENITYNEVADQAANNALN